MNLRFTSKIYVRIVSGSEDTEVPTPLAWRVTHKMSQEFELVARERKAPEAMEMMWNTKNSQDFKFQRLGKLGSRDHRFHFF